MSCESFLLEFEGVGKAVVSNVTCLASAFTANAKVSTFYPRIIRQHRVRCLIPTGRSGVEPKTLADLHWHHFTSKERKVRRPPTTPWETVRSLTYHLKTGETDSELIRTGKVRWRDIPVDEMIETCSHFGTSRPLAPFPDASRLLYPSLKITHAPP